MSSGISKAHLVEMLKREFPDQGSQVTIDVASIVREQTPDSDGCNWTVETLSNPDENPNTPQVMAVIQRYRAMYPRID